VFATQQLAVSGYLRDVRLEHAAALLRTAKGGVSIGNTALACGYADLSAFGKAFRARFGASPTEWRMQHLSGDTR